MPKYDFRCEACESEFSETLPMGTTTLPFCPSCKSAEKVRKIIRAPMVHFKGSGFYKTDSSKSVREPKEAKGTKEIKDSKEPKPPAPTTNTPAQS
jgi:putative FmdB family regulatory protein